MIMGAQDCMRAKFVLICARYNIITEVGDGTFGSVWRAINKESGEVVCHSA
jgi:serine/threonine protein kinase